MANVRIKLKNFDRFRVALGGDRFKGSLKKHIALSTRRGALLVKREIRQTIKGGITPQNAALTVALKRSAKPLVDFAELFRAVAEVQPDWKSAFIGIKRTTPEHNLARLLHDGATIPVTKKMRGLFYVLWLASRAARGDPSAGAPPLSGRAQELFERFQDWRPLGPQTRAIKIQGRPYIEQAFRSASLKTQIQEQWRRGVDAAFREGLRGR